VTWSSRITASASAPGVWRVVLIRAGRSMNGREYPAADLQRAVESRLFEGRPAMAFRKVSASGAVEFDHVLPDSLVGRTVANQVGFYRGTRWNESEQQVEGELHLLLDTPDGRRIDEHLRALESKGALDSLGLSIDGEGPQDAAGRVRLSHITSVDLVSHPSAGGAVQHRIAASRSFGALPMRTLLALLVAGHPRLVEGYTGAATNAFGISRHILARAKADAAIADVLSQAIGGTGEAKRFTESKDEFGLLAEISDLCSRLTEAETADVAKRAKEASDAEEARRVAEAAKAKGTPEGGTTPNAEDKAAIAELKKQMQESRVTESRTRLNAAAVAAKLPAKAVASLLSQHGGRFLEAGEETRLVEAQRAVIDDAIAAAGGTATIVRESNDRTRDLLAHVFNPHQVPAPKEGVPSYAFDGVALVERHLCGGVRLQEALYGGSEGKRRIREAVDSTTSAKTLQDAMNIALLAAYVGHHAYDGWQKIVRKTTLPNFRTAHIVKVPYYGNLPVVTKGSPYQAISTTTETEETLALVKYGALESILLEDVLNGDFIDLWQQRLQRLGRAAMETRSEVVHALHRDATMPTMGADSKTLTDSTRSPANEGTSVMSTTLATAIATVMEAITGMMAATGGSGVAKGLVPRFVVLPKEKIAAYNAVIQGIAGGNAGVDVAAMIKRMGWYIPEPIVDLRTTNAFDHYFFADPNEAEVIRFAELAGRSGPRITIADELSFGAMFTNDKLEAKIDDVFAAGAVDFAGIYGNDAGS
jgi:hypothetical protein